MADIPALPVHVSNDGRATGKAWSRRMTADRLGTIAEEMRAFAAPALMEPEN